MPRSTHILHYCLIALLLAMQGIGVHHTVEHNLQPLLVAASEQVDDDASEVLARCDLCLVAQQLSHALPTVVSAPVMHGVATATPDILPVRQVLRVAVSLPPPRGPPVLS